MFLRNGDSGPVDESEDALTNVPSLSCLLVTLKYGEGGDGGTKRSGSKTLSLSESEGIENNVDLSNGSDKLTVREL